MESFPTAPYAALPVSVEEEFFLVDVDDGSPTSLAARLSEMAPVTAGLYPHMVELATPPCTGLRSLRLELDARRAATIACAAEFGVGLLASSTYPALLPAMSPSTSSHYRQQLDEYRRLLSEQQVIGCHIHVGIGADEMVVPIMNRIRSMLAPLIAFSANSPFWMGADTGYASWRTVMWGRWPVSGPPPAFRSRAEFDDAVADMTRMGVISDLSNIYWDVRPSWREPSLEFRAFDVCRSVDEVIALAGMVRASVRVAYEEELEGVPLEPDERFLLQAARWQAARDGLGGRLVDVVDRCLKPSEDVLGSLLERLRPALEDEGDWEDVVTTVKRSHREGWGEQRQRIAYSRRNLIRDVVMDSMIQRSTIR